jgi:quercetin dioxygenase-like cupin family protein
VTKPIRLGTTTMRMLAEDGPFAVVEFELAPGFEGPLPHLHRETTDCFYVLDGSLVFKLDGERRDAPSGTFVRVPPGVVHTFSNPDPEHPARVLNMFAPPGLAGYLREIAAASAPGAELDHAALEAIAARYDFVSSE